MERINRNVLETKADLRLADKIDEIVRRINELEGGQEVNCEGGLDGQDCLSK